MQQLTLDQRKIVEQWFAEKAIVIGQCPVCLNRQFTLLDHLIAPPIFQNGSLTIGGSAYPMVMIMCMNCGHTHFHNAVMMGILPPEGGAPPSSEATPPVQKDKENAG